jgi:hypothetical protein
MMIFDVWVPTSVVLWLYTAANLLNGALSIAAVVELPRTDRWLRVLRGIAGAVAIVSIGSGASAIKLILLGDDISPDEALWRLLLPTLCMRWLFVVLSAWAALYIAHFRRDDRGQA